MKIEEVLKAVKEAIKHQELLQKTFRYKKEDDEALTGNLIIVEALEKQMPIKPRYYTDMYGHNRPGCPGCSKNEILYTGQKFCSVCGTKIDWGEES